MENLFGITAEDLEDFEDFEIVEDEDLSANLDLSKVQNTLEFYKDNEAWMAKSQVIASLPGMSIPMKTACIFMGGPQVLSQLFLIHSIAEGNPVEDSVLLFTIYCKLIGIDAETISHWIGMFFALGALPLEVFMSPGESLRDVNLSPGPMNTIYSMGSATTFDSILLSMKTLSPLLEDIGINFYEDNSLLEPFAKAEEVVPIEALAP